MKCELIGTVKECWSQMISGGRAWTKVSINGHIETIPMPQDWLDKLPCGTTIKITIETIPQSTGK